jgi:hypothetical protein
MLSITQKWSSGAEKTSTWYLGRKLVGNSLNLGLIKYGEVSNITEIQADGDELMAIFEKFPFKLVLKARVVRWFGADAQHIVGSLE